uniref:Chromosome 14 open reading frame 93 n=1 Tax=Eptatretus burgeri TaxID=7764 RepID=A0A8C4QKF0_EPTBU
PRTEGVYGSRTARACARPQSAVALVRVLPPPRGTYIHGHFRVRLGALGVFNFVRPCGSGTLARPLTHSSLDEYFPATNSKGKGEHSEVEPAVAATIVKYPAPECKEENFDNEGWEQPRTSVKHSQLACVTSSPRGPSGFTRRQSRRSGTSEIYRSPWASNHLASLQESNAFKRRKRDLVISKLVHRIHNQQGNDKRFNGAEGLKSPWNMTVLRFLLDRLREELSDSENFYADKELKGACVSYFLTKRREYRNSQNPDRSLREREEKKLRSRRYRLFGNRTSTVKHFLVDDQNLWEGVTEELMSDEEDSTMEPGVWVARPPRFRTPALTDLCRRLDIASRHGARPNRVLGPPSDRPPSQEAYHLSTRLVCLDSLQGPIIDHDGTLSFSLDEQGEERISCSRDDIGPQPLI